MEDTHLVRDITVALVLAFGGGLLAHRLRLSPIIGYLATGLAIGPFTPGYVADTDTIPQLAEVGVVFLLFGVGLHFRLSELAAVRYIALPAAVLQIVLVTLIGAGLGSVAGLPPREAFLFGMAVSISSTVVLVRALEERGLTTSIHGRTLIGWLIVQDLATILILVFLPLLAGDEDASTGVVFADALRALAFGAVILAAGFTMIPWLLTFVGRTGSRELFILMVVCLSLGIAAGAEVAGLSLALGAFIAGVAISETDSSHRAASDVLPLRDAFAVLFFVSVGMLVDPRSLIEHPQMLVIALVAILVAKPLVSAVSVSPFAVPARTALLCGAGLAQAGEFSFILIDAGSRLDLVASATYDGVLAASVISIALAPLAFRTAGAVERRLVGRRLWRLMDRQGAPPPSPPPQRDHVIIAGAGRVGRLAGNAFADVGVPYVFIEASLSIVLDLHRQGQPALWGDVSSVEVLDAAATAEARLLVLAVPDAAAAFVAIQHAREINPGISIVARAHSDSELGLLRRASPDSVVLPEVEGAIAIIRDSLRLLSIEPRASESEVATLAEEQYREHERQVDSE